MVNCPNVGCKEKLTKQELTIHVTFECSWRIIKCEYCTTSFVQNQKQVRWKFVSRLVVVVFFYVAMAQARTIKNLLSCAVRLWLPITSTLSLGSILFPIRRRQETPKTSLLSRRRHILFSRNYNGNEYKLSTQWFLGWFEWTGVSYDWLMVALNTINQS